MLLPAGPETVGGIGDVALKHFRDLRGFENYKQYYAQREEAQAIFEQEMKKAGGFSEFIDVSWAYNALPHVQTNPVTTFLQSASNTLQQTPEIVSDFASY